MTPDTPILESTSLLKSLIKDVPDFPKPGIIFKDITPLLQDSSAIQLAAEKIAEPFKDSDIQYVVGIEARGFIFGTLVSRILNTGFIPVRKKGKLPRESKVVQYDLEYGVDSLAIHADALKSKDKVLVVDDLLATGGTIGAVVNLLDELQADICGISFLIELSFLNGRTKLANRNIHSVLTY